MNLTQVISITMTKKNIAVGILFFLVLILATTVSAQDENLIGYWNFDEGSGAIAYDQSGNSRDGILTNGPQRTTGKFNGGLAFDGVNDYVGLGTGTLGVSTGITVAAWIRPSDISGSYKTIIDRGQYLYPFWLQLSGNTVRTGIRTSSTNYLTSIAKLAANEWVHVALTYQNGERIIYINGVQDNSNALTGTLNDKTNQEMRIGLGIGGSYAFSGIIDEVRIYNRALGPTEIANLYVWGSVSSDATPPTAIVLTNATPISYAEIALTWTASSDPDSGISHYNVYRDDSQTGQTASLSYLDTGLAPATTYTYHVTAVNGDSLESNISNRRNATTLQETIPPSIQNVQSAPLSQTAITITWDTDESATSQVLYGLTQAHNQSTPLDATLVTSHAITLAGLLPNTTYYYSVRSEDLFGNEAVPVNSSFTTSEPAPPAVISGLTVDGYAADSMFDNISDACINIVKSKKWLLHSRSYGQNILNGIDRLRSVDPKYDISQIEYDINDGSLIPPFPSVIPENAFELSNIVHNLCELYPRAGRIIEYNYTVRDHFYDDMDIGMLEIWVDPENYQDVYQTYVSTIESLQQDYPDVNFVYLTTHLGCGIYGGDDDSLTTAAYNVLLRQDYEGEVPIFDFYDLISTRSETPGGEACVKTNGVYNHPDCECTTVINNETYRICCPEYNIGDHPRAYDAEIRFGKALYVLGSQLYCRQCETDADCYDGNYCNGAETCSAGGMCEAGTPPCPGDGYACTLDCNEATDSCETIPSDSYCSDANSCTDDVCMGPGGDADGCSFTANDANSCTLTGECAANARCSAGSCIADSTPAMCANPASCGIVSCDASFACVYQDCPIPADLQVWLPMDGNADDATGNENNGIIYGTEPTTDRFGNGNKAIYFDGQDYIDLGTGNFGFDATNEFTITLWINMHENLATTFDPIIDKGQWNEPFYFDIDQGSKIRSGVRTSTTYYLTANTPLTLNEWTHVAMTYKDGERAIYMNGIAENADAPTGTLATSNKPTYIGRLPNAENYFRGDMDDLKIYNRALSSAEIMGIYNDTSGYAASECGNGIIETSELCDDNNAVSGDGCSALCALEAGYTCTGEPSMCAQCAITNASWDRSQAMENDVVTLHIQGLNCDGIGLDFAVLEDDFGSDTPATTNPATVSFAGNSAATTWSAEWECDGDVGGICILGNPEYYFVAALSNDNAISFDSRTGTLGLLTVVSDTAAPVLTNINSLPSFDSATITWDTDEPATTRVEYGLDSGYGSSTALDVALVVSHSAVITGLQGNTTYHYRVISTDSIGNEAASADHQFTTILVDTTPPTQPQNLSLVLAAETELSISWAPSSDTESLIMGYTIYRNNVSLAQITETAYLDTGLSPNTTYAYEVSAMNSYYLESARSSPLAATTLAVITPPTPEDYIHYWNFDEGAGATLADLAGARHGTLENGVSWVTGKSGSALQFDGVNDWVDLGSGILGVSSGFSISTWIRVLGDGSGVYDGIFIHGLYMDPIYVQMYGGDTLRTGVRTLSSTSYLSANDVISDTAWHHVAMTYASGERNIYIDGSLAATNAPTGNLRDRDRDASIGAAPDGASNFNGIIDDMKIYDRALNQQEVLDLYNAG